jgi:hypothetical protein
MKDILIPPILALVVVVGTAAAGTGDYALVMPENGVGTGSCAKSLEACRDAQAAVQMGYITSVPKGTPTRCQPKPGCFSKRSNCIVGFNCK